jgi:hypothetical protein
MNYIETAFIIIAVVELIELIFIVNFMYNRWKNNRKFQ